MRHGVTSDRGDRMLLVTRADSRRVFVLGVAGLVPAALVTLLLVHQPAIGAAAAVPDAARPADAGRPGAGAGDDRRVGDHVEAVAAGRRSAVWRGRASPSLLCIGPFVESNPRARLFALDLCNDGRGRVGERAGQVGTRG